MSDNRLEIKKSQEEMALNLRKIESNLLNFDSQNNFTQNWLIPHYDKLRKDFSFMDGKDIIMVTVTKDVINFLKMMNIYGYKDKINIIAIFDISLPYRPIIRKILDNTLKNCGLHIPVYTSMKDFYSFTREIVERVGEENAPVCMKFDHAAADFRHYKNINVRFNSVEFENHFEEFEQDVKNFYEEGCKAKKEHSNEFVFMLDSNRKIILNSFLVHLCRCYLTNCYGDLDVCVTNDAHAVDELTYKEEMLWLASKIIKFKFETLAPIENTNINLYELQKKVRDQKVRFVFSSDFGGGKTSYILQKAPNQMLSKDMFTALFNPKFYYGPGGVDYYQKPEISYIFDSICHWELDGNTEPLYIKMEGRLDRYFFTFLSESVMPNWNYFHLYFKDYEFHIVIKENEDMAVFKRDLGIFARIHLIDVNKIKIFKSINHCEKFEELSIDELFKDKTNFYKED